MEEYSRRGSLSDDKIYALTGWLYINGGSPDTFNFEHPPLAKYMIGFSELAFSNHVILGLFISVFTLIIVYLISRKVIAVFPFTLIVPLLLSLDKLYIRFSSISMLDIYATFFTSLAILLLFLREKRYATPLLYVVIGLAISCKWTAAFLIIIPPLYYALKGELRQLKLYPVYLVVTVLTYMATYVIFFHAGNTLQDFKNLQWEMLTYHWTMHIRIAGTPPLRGLLIFLTGVQGPTQIQTLFLDPTNGTVTVGETTRGISLFGEAYNPLTWPLSFSASLMALYYSVKQNRNLSPIPSAFLLSLPILFISSMSIYINPFLIGLPFAFTSLVYVMSIAYIKSKNKAAAQTALVLYILSNVIWSFFISLPQYIET